MECKNIYLIPTEEFCAIDSNLKPMFMIKEIRPDIHCEINNCYKKAAEIEELNGIYPETFVNNTKKSIFEKNYLSSYIPVIVNKRIINDNKIYYKCSDLEFNYKFIIPSCVINDSKLCDFKTYSEMSQNDISELKKILCRFKNLLKKTNKISLIISDIKDELFVTPKKRTKTKGTK